MSAPSEIRQLKCSPSFRFTGFQQEIATNIAFRPIMPNGATFIILGQQVRVISCGLCPILLKPCPDVAQLHQVRGRANSHQPVA